MEDPFSGQIGKYYDNVVIGGGIAGLSCAEALADLQPDASILLVSASSFLKGVANVAKITENLETFDVIEKSLMEVTDSRKSVAVKLGFVKRVEPESNTVLMQDDSQISYGKLCLCTGATPKLICHHPLVIGIRDTDSVEVFQSLLKDARRVLVVGNGGIALELVSTITNCELVWCVKDKFIGNTFFDASASKFFLSQRTYETGEQYGAKCPKASVDSAVEEGRAGMEQSSTQAEQQPPAGHALGPLWLRSLNTASSKTEETKASEGRPSKRLMVERKGLILETSVEVARILDTGTGDRGDLRGGEWENLVGEPGERPTQYFTMGDKGSKPWPLLVQLTNGRTYGCDLVVSATGVVPATNMMPSSVAREADGGLKVGEDMKVEGLENVYAAGDVASMTWPDSELWFQMRLWSQARLMGLYAAQCMASQVDELGSGFHFELFAHMTKFMGYKVVLLGLFNGQGLGEAYTRAIMGNVVSSKGLEATEGGQSGGCKMDEDRKEDGQESKVSINYRVTPKEEYIKLVLVDGRVKGAILIGDTDLEETFENLILNELNVEALGIDLLDPDVDIEDYFD